MNLPTIVLMPSASASYTVNTDTYTSDGRGFVYNALVADIPGLTALGGILIAPRNNTATRDPTAADDYTALFGPGSLWENVSSATLWMCTAMGSTPGSATWTQAAAGLGTLTGNGSSLLVTPTGATTSRTLANLFSDLWNNVKTFGAVGNGSTDDSAAINAAVAEAGVNGQPVYFPAGTYKTTQTIQVDLNSLGALSQGIWLIGDGMQRSIIDNSATGGLIGLWIYASGGTAPSSRKSAFFGGVRDLGIKANYAGQALQIGKTDTSDALNSFEFRNVWVKNLSTSANAIGTQVNFVLDTVFSNLVSNCSQFGKALELNSTQFCNFIGGSYSTAFTGVHLTNTPGGANAYTFANNFFAPDVENITGNCVLVDVTNGNGHNSFYGGQFVWNYPSGSNYAIASSASSGSALVPQSTRFYDVNFAPASGSGALYGGLVLDPSNYAGVAIFGNNYGDGTTPGSGAPSSGTTYTNNTGQAQVVTIYASSGMTAYTVQVNPAQSGPSSTINGNGSVTFVLRPGYAIQCSGYTGGTLSWLWFPLAA